MAIFFKMLGALGMLLISYGIIHRSPLTRNYLFTAGGILLLIYSIFLQDPVFIPLQIIFTLSSLWEIRKIKRAARTLPLSVSTDEIANLLTKK